MRKRLGTFLLFSDCTVENHAERGRKADLQSLLVDTASELSWIAQDVLLKIGVVPEKRDVKFMTAGGELVGRDVGFAILRVGERFTVDEVVFARKGDLLLLGARALKGLNLAVDSRKQKLVNAGPFPSASGFQTIVEP